MTIMWINKIGTRHVRFWDTRITATLANGLGNLCVDSCPEGITPTLSVARIHWTLRACEFLPLSQGKITVETGTEDGVDAALGQ
jgi:hypothetical protein